MRLGVAAESARDAEWVSALADRVLVEAPCWIQEEDLNHLRRWCGLEQSAFLDLHRVKALARERGIKSFGSFGEAPEALFFRKVLRLFASEAQPPELVVMSRDTDKTPDKRLGLTQAIEGRDWPFQVLSALATPELEAWHLAAFVPQTPAELAAHRALRQKHGFDPCTQSHKLTSGKKRDPKDCKVTLSALQVHGDDREERWASLPLQLLCDRGKDCGLASYLIAVQDQLLPLVSADTTPSTWLN